jgi:hypothetical protein
MDYSLLSLILLLVELLLLLLFEVLLLEVLLLEVLLLSVLLLLVLSSVRFISSDISLPTTFSSSISLHLLLDFTFSFFPP